MDAPLRLHPGSRSVPGGRSASADRLGLTLGMAALAWLCALGLPALAGEGPAMDRFREVVQPILEDRCFACHGNGMKKGGVSFDGLADDEATLQDHDLWWKVLKNVRAGIMPPSDQPRPTPEETQRLADWIKREAFRLDPDNPDPGRVTIRRLNRFEYRNTIRDLMGVDFNTEEEFPPDDTGYGFDTIGDVLTVSPLLLEKYLQAAEVIAARAVPTVSKVVREQDFRGKDFRGQGEINGDRLTFYKEAKLGQTFQAAHDGDYRFHLKVAVDGSFDFDPGKCRVTFKVDDTELLCESYAWQDNKDYPYELRATLPAGEHRMTFELTPETPPEQKKTSVDYRILTVKVEGPLDRQHWVHPPNYERFFTRDEPPQSADERRQYAREVLARFATRAFRRPVEQAMLDRLVMIAEEGYTQPGKRFEEGVARAVLAVLASPRFQFRVEAEAPGPGGRAFAEVDEYTLASRLSYFLWSTMPDDELFDLARRGELRENLKAQVDRMLKDPRSERLIENFAGQWLQARDIEGISIDAREVLARDNGEEKELEQARREFRRRLTDPKIRKADGKAARPPFPAKFFRPAAELDGPLRRAMRRETEMSFAHVVREDRSVLELVDADYTFLNERLAKHYGIPDVKGPEMRKVTLPEGHVRGGVLTQGAILAVTSNPTRTSPVKRGQFILENILGTPAPPPPPEIPQFEEAEKAFKDREPTTREILELHRSKPLCAACHQRMDPLGLALENFNPLGMYRETERKQPIDSAGKLLTGESFHDIRDVKRILVGERRADLYRCLAEKLLTYATGRGPEYYDVETVDQIVDRLERDRGRFSTLLMGVVESAPFQKRRSATVATAEAKPTPSERAQARTQP